MRRRRVLAALGSTSVALAGCVAGRADGCSFPDWKESSGFDRPDSVRGPTCPPESKTIECRDGFLDSSSYETAEPVPYPEPPRTFTDGTVVEYVEAFERAYVTHDIVCGHRESSSYVTSIYATIHRTARLGLYEERTAVFLLRSGGASAGIDPDAGRWDGGAAPPNGVVYAVEDSGGDRIEFDTERLQTDEGEYRDPAEMDSDTIAARVPDPVEGGKRVVVFE
jgi:hypothetical protein